MLAVVVGILLFAGSPACLPAQHVITHVPPPQPQPTVSTDPLGRETPRSMVIGFLKYGARGDYATAARYLQHPPAQTVDLIQFAWEARVLRPNIKINVDLLSDDPNGTVEAGLPLGQVRAGVIQVGDEATDLILVRVNDPTWGKIWLVSQDSVAELPKLAAQVESEKPTVTGQIRLAIQRGPALLGMSSTQWVVWLISIPFSWLLAQLAALLLSAPRRIWCKLRKLPFRTVWNTSVGLPLKCILAILLQSFFAYELHPPLLYRVYYLRFLGALLIVCLGWLVTEIVDHAFGRKVNHVRTQNQGGESILVLMRRLSRIVIFIVALIGAFSILGLNVTTAVAGLGIGGLAVALGAQKTLENLIGGVSLLMDKALQIGDLCKIGDQLGVVEDIGLRSLKLRALNQNLLIVPNGLLAQMQFENMKSRPKLLIRQNFSLRIETQVEQLRFVLDTVQTMLSEHPAIESGTSRLRVTNFAGAAFELELFAYGKTGDWAHLTAIREDVLLKIAEIVKAAGTGFAAHTQLTYQSPATSVDAEKAP
jgi:MscS family membrane protein